MGGERGRGEDGQRSLFTHIHSKGDREGGEAYSVSTIFRLELMEPSAREVGVNFFFSSDAVSSLAGFEPCPKNKYLSIRSRRKLVDTMYQNLFA